MVDKQGSLRDAGSTVLSEAFLSASEGATLRPAEKLEEVLSVWQDWLGLRVKAGEISAATKNAYARGVKQYFSFAEGCNRTDLETFQAWKADLVEQHDPQTVKAWLAGLKSFIYWRVETQRFL